MNKYLLIGVLVLVPSFAFAATPNDQVRQTLVQQLLAEFVSDVNSIQAMQTTIATAVDPTQFLSLSMLLQNQFTDTETQLDNLLNPSGVSEQTNNRGQIESISSVAPISPLQIYKLVYESNGDQSSFYYAGNKQISSASVDGNDESFTMNKLADNTSCSPLIDGVRYCGYYVAVFTAPSVISKDVWGKINSTVVLTSDDGSVATSTSEINQ